MFIPQKMKDFNFKSLFFAVKHKQDILFAQDILYAPTVYLVEVYPIEGISHRKRCRGNIRISPFNHSKLEHLMKKMAVILYK
jgi:hypothetical protein